MYIGARRDLRATLQEEAARVEREQELRIVQAQVTERARIAREMHDVLAHRLSLVALHAGALEYCRGLTDAEVAEAAAVTRNAHQALEDLHAILGVLRTVDADGRPGTAPADARRPAVTGRGGPGCRDAGTAPQRRRATWGRHPWPRGRSVYRMVQESLTNARKHAPDTTVDVTLSGGPGGGLGLEVRNPIRVGAAASTTPGSGLGLIGLTERAELIGGRLEHEASDARLRRQGLAAVAGVNDRRAAVRVVIVDDDALVRAGLR